MFLIFITSTKQYNRTGRGLQSEVCGSNPGCAPIVGRAPDYPIKLHGSKNISTKLRLIS